MLKTTKRSSSSRFGSTLTIILGIPFALIGTSLVYLAIQTLVSSISMQAWPTVPATLLSVSLEKTKSSERATATYYYLINGQKYDGHRVSIYNSDNLGSFHRRTYEELQDYFNRGAPYPVHVDPKDPTKSILKPDFRLEVLGFSSLFIVAFGGVGWGLIIVTILRVRKDKLEAELIEKYPNEPWKQRAE